MKFLIDIGVGKSVEEWFKTNGYDVKSVRDIDSRAKDADILKLATSEGRMVLTMDKNFGELVYKCGMHHSGVLILRLEDAKREEKIEVISRIMSNFSGNMKNKFCVFQNGKLRVRE